MPNISKTKKIANNLLLVSALISVLFFFNYSFAQAVVVYQAVQGGTGTSSPSGILWGDNGVTGSLKTLVIGTNLTLTGSTLSAAGGSGSPGGTNGQLQYNGTGAFAGVATSSASCSSGVACSAFTVVGSVSPSITNTGVTSLAATYPLVTTGSVGALTLSTAISTTTLINAGAGIATSTSPGGAISISNTGVLSAFGRTGAVVATAGDYTSAQITEVTNLFFTNARAIASTLTGYVSGAGTVGSGDTILQAIQKLNGNIAALVTGVSSVTATNATLTISPTTGAVLAGLNLANPNTFTGLQQFNANASTTQFTSTGATYLATLGGNVGIGATSSPSSLLSIQGVANFGVGTSTIYTGLTVGQGTGTIIATNGQLVNNQPGAAGIVTHSTTGNNEAALFAGPSGTSVGSISNVDFKIQTNNAEVARFTTGGFFGISTTTPGSLFSIGGIANFTTATSTFYGTGGHNIIDGCYAINNVCIGGGGGAVSSVTATNATLTISPTTGAVLAGLNLANPNYWTGLQNFTTASTSQFTATSSAWLATVGGSVGIGTTSPSKLLTVEGNQAGGVARIQRDFPSVVAGNTVGTYDILLNEIGVGALADAAGPAQTFGVSLAGGAENLMANMFGFRDGADTSGGLGFTTYNLTTPVVAMVINHLQQVGIGSSTPSAQLSDFAGGDFLSHAASVLFAIGSSTAGTATSTLFSVNSSGLVGIATTSPWSQFSLAMASSTNAFVSAVSGSTTPAFIISSANNNGNVGLSTTTPFASLSIGTPTGTTAWWNAGNLFQISSSTTSVLNVSDNNTGAAVVTLGGNAATIQSTLGTLNIQTLGANSVQIQTANGTNSDRLTVGSNAVTIISGTSVTASTVRFAYTGAADTSLTASTEAPAVYLNLGQTRQHATGALTTQRDFRLTGGVYSFAGASALSNYSLLSLDGIPATGANSTVSTSSALFIGSQAVTSTATSSNIISFAPTGATNNFAAMLYGRVLAANLTAFATGDSAICSRAGGEISLDSGVSSCIISSKFVKNYQGDDDYASAFARIQKLQAIYFSYKDDNKNDIGLFAEDVAKIDPRYAQYANSPRDMDGHHYNVGDPVAINWTAIQADMLVVLQHNTEGQKPFDPKWLWLAMGFLLLWNVLLTFKKK